MRKGILTFLGYFIGITILTPFTGVIGAIVIIVLLSIVVSNLNFSITPKDKGK